MIEKIILVFKTHFDIGFTDLAKNVIKDYSEGMLRQMLETCRATEHMGPLHYVWTMPAWPLRYILGHCDPQLKPELEHFIRNDQIVWHALPFTTHTDCCAPEEYARTLLYARELSEEYHKPYPIAGKMTDVPGHGLMLVLNLHSVHLSYYNLLVWLAGRVYTHQNNHWISSIFCAQNMGIDHHRCSILICYFTLHHIMRESTFSN